MQGINQIGLCTPWDNKRNEQFITNIRVKQTTLRINTKRIQGINTMNLGAPWYPSDNTYLHNLKLE